MRSGRRDWVAGGLGFEPRLTESESAVLPLDDPPPTQHWRSRGLALAPMPRDCCGGLDIGGLPGRVHPLGLHTVQHGEAGGGQPARLRAVLSATVAIASSAQTAMKRNIARGCPW